MSNIVINVKPQNSKVNVSNYNSHYITYESFQNYKNFVEENYVTDVSFYNTINSLDIPKKLTDLQIDLGVVVYDPNKDYLEVVGVN